MSTSLVLALWMALTTSPPPPPSKGTSEPPVDKSESTEIRDAVPMGAFPPVQPATETSAATRPSDEPPAPLPPADNKIYFDRPITLDDVRGKTLRELALMRNTIYARVGNVFRKAWLHDHFMAEPWYRETGLDETKLSDLDHQNAAFLDRYETAMPRQELTKRLEQLELKHPQPNPDLLTAVTKTYMKLAIADDGSIYALLPNKVLRWSPAGKPLPSLAFDKFVLLTDMQVSPDGKTLAVVGNDTTKKARATEVDIATGKPLWRSDPLKAFFVFELLPAGMHALLQKLEKGKVQLPPGVNFRVKPDSEFVLGRKNHFEIWQTAGDETVPGLSSGPNYTNPIALSSDGKYMALLNQLEQLEIWDLVRNKQLLTLTHPPAKRSQLAWGPFTFTPDSKALLLREGQTWKSVDLPGGNVLWAQVVPEPDSGQSGGQVLQAIDPSGHRFVWSRDADIWVWDLQSGKPDDAWHSPLVWSQDEATEAVLLSRALGESPPAGVVAEKDISPLDNVKLLDEQLTLEELKDLSRRDLMLLRNTVSARRGKVWDDELKPYFANKSWYHPDLEYTDDRLTSLDRKNLKLIGSLEDSLGGPLPDKDARTPRRLRA
jgi:WD40 repeat protein